MVTSKDPSSNSTRFAPMLLNSLNLATGTQDLTPIDAQELLKSGFNSKVSNPFPEIEFFFYTDRNHAARQIYHAARGCSSNTASRVIKSERNQIFRLGITPRVVESRYRRSSTSSFTPRMLDITPRVTKSETNFNSGRVLRRA
ncbi:unnamed protein product [Trifolium pratense]|uniref:Uncharacterized protein n=1 Tax=Trifolium pratense TaxID=57577 RepID=A0ACB0KFJ1_TRIPR|nr:unnamed protein product [Trifolium pratense]